MSDKLFHVVAWAHEDGDLSRPSFLLDAKYFANTRPAARQMALDDVLASAPEYAPADIKLSVEQLQEFMGPPQ